MTRAGLEGFGRSLRKDDEVVIEATGNAMAVVRVLAPHVARVIVGPTPIPNACGGWWRGATRLSGTARGSRTRCMRSYMPI
jgi:hypothetical protein